MTYVDAAPSVDIDLQALCANFEAIARATPDAEAAAVVKCDAYGLGLTPVARALSLKQDCKSFFVAYAETGAALRSALQDIAPASDIYIFNGPTNDTLTHYRINKLIPILNTLEQATLWASVFPGAPAALHVDTGMNRLGLDPDDLGALQQISGLNITLIMSHFACASTPGAPMLDRQYAAFKEIAAHFPEARASLASTGGALINVDYGFDLTRLGVGLYGVGPFDRPHDQIKPVARLTAPVLQTRRVRAGASAGYDCTVTFDTERTLATVALGYGDGYPRAGSNRAHAYIGGAPCPVVGRISMDLIILDVTGASRGVAPGDRAEFFGPRLLIEEAAAACGTIGYELLTGLGARIDRRYFWGEEAAETMLTGR